MGAWEDQVDVVRDQNLGQTKCECVPGKEAGRTYHGAMGEKGSTEESVEQKTRCVAILVSESDNTIDKAGLCTHNGAKRIVK